MQNLLNENKFELHENKLVGERHFHMKRSFSSSLVPLFQSESKCKNEFCMQFNFHANQSHFHSGFALRLAFETEAQGNLEMAYGFAQTVF